ncbi:MAG: hypothetical protein JXN10_05425 [Clostridia bacterium]|nr:hypothetical protein [Clostridia bacterium]MBN2882948.1 hypothetical protein [Clostridia bacterium]
MKKIRLIIAISLIVVIFGGVFASDALGFWQTSGSRNLWKSESSQAGEPHEEDIEGTDHGLEVGGSTTVSMALEMGIPEDVLLEYLGDISNPDALVKDLITANGYSFGKVKGILNSYIKID